MPLCMMLHSLMIPDLQVPLFDWVIAEWMCSMDCCQCELLCP